MVIVVCHWCLEKGKLQFDVLDLVDVSDGTADGLTNCILSRLEKHGIPSARFVGFSADTCNVNFGRIKSVSTLLRDRFPKHATVKCTCHNFHLCAKHSYKALPPELIELLHAIPAHFSNSRDRRDKLNECLRFLKLDELEILKPGETRWLTFKNCAVRILQQYDALILHFISEVAENPTVANNRILFLLQDPFTKILLEFFIQGKTKTNFLISYLNITNQHI